MPTQGLIVEAVNIDELRQAFNDAPKETYTFVKQAMFRFARRVARKTKSEYLSGAPGIKGGPWKRIKDKNITGFTSGSDLAGLKAITKTSRIVRTHVEGATITAKGGGFLFLSRKNNRKGEGAIFARVRSVTIPARVPIQAVWQREMPKAMDDVGSALERSMRVALERNLKAFTQTVNWIANL